MFDPKIQLYVQNQLRNSSSISTHIMINKINPQKNIAITNSFVYCVSLFHETSIWQLIHSDIFNHIHVYFPPFVLLFIVTPVRFFVWK